MAIAELKIILLAYQLSHNPTVAQTEAYKALPPSSQAAVQTVISSDQPLPPEIEEMLKRASESTDYVDHLPTFETA